MEIAGEWLRCDDGVTRPVVGAGVLAADGTVVPDRFLVDSGADRTVLRACPESSGIRNIFAAEEVSQQPTRRRIRPCASPTRRT